MNVNHDSGTALSAEEWLELETLSTILREHSLTDFSDETFQPIERAVSKLENLQDWEGITRLREMLTPYIVGESYANQRSFQSVARAGVRAAEALDDHVLAGRYLHDLGQHQHRTGQHRDAIEAFERSEAHFIAVPGHSFQATESYYMTALCYRALHQREQAQHILNKVFDRLEPDDPWRAHPLGVLVWLKQDAGELDEAESLMERVIALHETHEGTDAYILIQSLADLGEIKGLVGKDDEAEAAFKRSLSIADQHLERGGRVTARTLVKYAQFCTNRGRHQEALDKLRDAEWRLTRYARYPDYLWRVHLMAGFVFFRMGVFGLALRKIRVALLIRSKLGLSNVRLVLDYGVRWVRGIGPPR